MAVDRNKASAAAGLIEEIRTLLAESPELPLVRLKCSELAELTGRKSIDPMQLCDLMGFPDEMTLAERLLMPESRSLGLTEEQIYDTVRKICLAYYSEAEEDYWIGVLCRETGLEIKDYIFFPYTKGMEVTATEREIAAAILADRQN